MSIRHLNCATFRPPLAGRFVAHVLVVETPRGLALVDTGIGTRDIASPARLGPSRFAMGAVLDLAETALRQLGADADEVADIVLTHLDFDHVGGLPDFPNATVHTTAAEHRAALVSPDLYERFRYRRAQFSHAPAWKLYDGPGEPWRDGLTAHEVVEGIALLPMPGHSRGHAAVAVNDGEALLVHAGDAAFDASSYRPSLGAVPALRALELSVAHNRRAVLRNHRVLAALDAQADVTVITAHDPRLLPSPAAP